MRNILAKVKKFIQINHLALVLFAFAVFLRLYKLKEFVTFLGDQGRDAIIVRKIVTFEHFPAIGAPTSIGHVFLGPFYYYFISPCLLLTGFDPVGLALGVALTTIIGIAISYFIVKKELNKTAAIFLLFLSAFSAPLIELSRFSWNPNILPIFSFLTIYFFYKMITDKGFIYSFLFGMFLSLSLQLHYLALLITPVFALYVIKEFITHSNRFKLFKKVILSFISFIIFYSPLILFDLKNNFINSKQLLEMFTKESVIVSSFKDRLAATTTSFSGLILSADLSPKVLLLFFVVVILVSFYYVLKTKNTFFTINFLAFVFFIINFSLLNSERHIHYFTPIYLSFFIIVSYVFSIRVKKCNLCKIVVALFLFAFVFLNSQKFSIIFKEGNRQIDRVKRVSTFLAHKINNKPYNIATWPIAFSEDPYVYFLTLQGLKPANREKIEITNQMFIICEVSDCPVLNSPSWNISMFGKAKIARIWEIEGLSIYKLVHKK